jgi:uncharacterized RDD family membrane protein YckC
MKCPKCSYLGFDTGDRCKNCGYDFSLMPRATDADGLDAEIDLNPELGAIAPLSDAWAEQVTFRPASTPPAPPPSPIHLVPDPTPSARPMPDAGMPLFARTFDEEGDEPLIKLPAAPRAPLAVRKTPDIPRLRAVPRPARRAEPALDFLEEIEPDPEPAPRPAARPAVASRLEHAGPGSVGARVAAMGIDHLILFAIDAGVLYFTVRMAGLAMAEWRALPVAPLLTFLLFLKLAYFCAFTAVGGQTIGKMALKIRVVTDADEAVDGARAVQRTIAAGVSSLLLGLGFVPALMDGERRAFHDRVAHTRVVGLRSV